MLLLCIFNNIIECLFVEIFIPLKSSPLKSSFSFQNREIKLFNRQLLIYLKLFDNEKYRLCCFALQGLII